MVASKIPLIKIHKTTLHNFFQTKKVSTHIVKEKKIDCKYWLRKNKQKNH